MKKIFYIMISVTLLGSPACTDFLNEVPKSQVSPENFYQTAQHAEQAVVGAYNALQRVGVYGRIQYFNTTDLVRFAPFNTQGGMGTYTMNSGNSEVILPLWADHFRGINEANAAITHIPGIDMDEERKNVLVAEARFLRALMYFNLVRYFGDVPYKETETNSLNELNAPRDPASFVYGKIIEDLDFGIANLAVKGEVEPGRATVGAAKTMLSKVYLTLGSLELRDGTGDGKTNFQLAAQYAKEVLDEGNYQLVSYFPDVFTTTNKYNEEIIFDVQFKSGGLEEGNYIGMHLGLMGPPPLGGSWGSMHSTEYFHTIYDPTDVVRQEWTTAHVRVVGDGVIKIDYPEMHGQPWKIGKFRRFPVRTPDYNFTDHDIHWPVFRLGEVYLIYAEALNELNDGPTSEVFNALNRLRERARNINYDGSREVIHYDVLPREINYDPNILPDITLADYPDYSSMKEYIEYERARELGGEAKRWFDLVRWGNLVERIRFLKDHIPEGRTQPERRDWYITADNIQEFHIKYPIPLQEIQANNLMTQNPGY